MLPSMSGWELLDRALEKLDRLNDPVMIVPATNGKTGYPSTLGVAGWFTKTLDVPRFLAAGEGLAGTPKTAATKNSAEQSTSGRVLIVEDEAMIRDLLREQLEAEGYVTEAVGNIAEARYRIEAETPDLILLDLMLPIEHGWTFLQTRREDALLASIPVVAMSAAPEALLLEAETLGADAFLSKPFDLDTVTALIRSFVG
jgi:CheY-like chemotaxis protein